MYPQIANKPDRFIIQKVDASDPNSMNISVENAKQKYGRIDNQINSAGGYRAGNPLHETSYEKFNQMHSLNLHSVFSACKAVIPTMIEQEFGKIVNIAARPGLSSMRSGSAYIASKSGVIRLTESMAAELNPYGINVYCILLGTIDTPQNRASMPDSDHRK